MPDHADLIVLGGGPAGAVSAWLAARYGLKVLRSDPLRTRPRLAGPVEGRRRGLRRQVVEGTRVVEVEAQRGVTGLGAHVERSVSGRRQHGRCADEQAEGPESP